MRRRVLVLIAAVLLLGAPCFSLPNLISNPGFETGLDNSWTRTANVSPESLIQQNSTSWGHAQWYYFSGSEAAFIAVGGGNGEGRISQRVFVSPGAQYTARVRFRAADNVQSHTWGNTSDNERAALCVREYDLLGNPITTEQRVYASETMGWETLELTFTTSSSTALVEIGVSAYLVENFYATLGRAVFDSFELIGPSPSDLTIASAKSRVPGASVFLRGKTVTASLGGVSYIEESDRSAGIKVIGAARPGRYVDVMGVVSDAGGERAITNATVAEGLSVTPLRSLGISSRSAYSLLPVGLLVTAWGNVESFDTPLNTLVISDGGGVGLKVYWNDATRPAVGNFLRVEGALGSEQSAGGTIPVLRAVTSSVPKDTSFLLPSLLWASSTRPNGTTRFWDPDPVISLGSNLLCVAYRPKRSDGSQWYAVGMTPPSMLTETLLNAQPELAACHDHGVGVIGYADCIMFHSDMLAHDGINYSGLYALDAAGMPVINNSWDAGTNVSCVNNPQWVDLQKQVATVTAQAGFDNLQLDVYPYAIAPGYQCHCTYCQLEWMSVSQTLFGSSQPMPSSLNFSNAVHRAYFEWRLGNFTSFLKSVESQAQLVNPQFHVLQNHSADTVDFVREAIDGALTISTTELWHLSLGDESTLYMNRLAESANGSRVIGTINYLAQIQPVYRYRVTLGEAYAGGGMIYAAVPGYVDATTGQLSRDYYDFIRGNVEWYADTHSSAPVGILYSWRDHTYIQKPSQGDTISMGQGTGNYRITASMLARMGVSYDCLIMEKGLSADKLSKYRVLVAPNLSLVDDTDAALLEQYVRSGGCLLSTGALGTLKQTGSSFTSRSPSLLKAWTGLTAGSSSWNAQLGSGRVSYVYQAYTGSSETTRVPTSSYQSACTYMGMTSPLKVTAASPVEAVVRAGNAGIAIHLIRLGPPEGLVDRSVHLDYELPAGSVIGSVDFLSPDFAGSTGTYSVNAGKLHVDINRVDNYSLVGIRLGQQ